ncbi:MAG TPA: type II toxin-antitoxin system RelE/ParE family toxin [Pirellulales bacterium]|jgi:mRNA interferase RelE/StbE|nr:type II toxin-antitoxin system RelE/ParE family toxin [Pirellulales bacterium]
MRYRVELKASAADALARVPKAHRQRIAKKIDRLADVPRPPGAKKLAGAESLYRIRVGGYRIIYQVNDDILLVLVVRIGGRGDVYRHLT